VAVPAEEAAAASEHVATTTAPSGPANPLASVSAWVKELALYGAGGGIMAGLNEVSTLADLAVMPAAIVSLALMGALSGLLVGGTLKTLRGRVPAAVGLLLAALGPGLLYGLALVSADAPSTKLWTISLAWAAMVVPLVPVAAVRRTRGQPTAVSNVLLGVLAGAIILGVKALVGW
jgi:hypothetical protein